MFLYFITVWEFHQAGLGISPNEREAEINLRGLSESGQFKEAHEASGLSIIRRHCL